MTTEADHDHIFDSLHVQINRLFAIGWFMSLDGTTQQSGVRIGR
jgi:hypothetical protein